MTFTAFIQNCQLRIMYPTKPFFRYEGETDIPKLKLREFATNGSVTKAKKGSSSSWKRCQRERRKQQTALKTHC